MFQLQSTKICQGTSAAEPEDVVLMTKGLCLDSPFHSYATWEPHLLSFKFKFPNQGINEALFGKLSASEIEGINNAKILLKMSKPRDLPD